MNDSVMLGLDDKRREKPSWERGLLSKTNVFNAQEEVEPKTTNDEDSNRQRRNVQVEYWLIKCD